MTASVSKVEKHMRYFPGKGLLSPQVKNQSYFREAAFESQSNSESDGDSGESRGTEIQDSIYGIDHTALLRQHSSKRDLKKFTRAKSKMFVKGATNTFKSDDELLNSDHGRQKDEDESVELGNNQQQVDTSAVFSLNKMPSIVATGSEQNQSLIVSPRGKVDKSIPNHRFLLSRKSSFVSIWNFIILASILLDLVLIPLEVSLQDVEYVGALSFTLINLIQAIYVVDIWVNFCKTYNDEQVREVTDLHSIRLRYFESYDFCIDIFACAPTLAFFKIFYYKKGYNQIFLLVRIVKALKLKSIVVEFHQRFYVSSKLYFLGYLISVLIIVDLTDRSCISKAAFGMPSPSAGIWLSKIRSTKVRILLRASVLIEVMTKL